MALVAHGAQGDAAVHPQIPPASSCNLSFQGMEPSGGPGMMSLRASVMSARKLGRVRRPPRREASYLADIHNSKGQHARARAQTGRTCKLCAHADNPVSFAGIRHVYRPVYRPVYGRVCVTVRLEVCAEVRAQRVRARVRAAYASITSLSVRRNQPCPVRTKHS